MEEFKPKENKEYESAFTKKNKEDAEKEREKIKKLMEKNEKLKKWLDEQSI